MSKYIDADKLRAEIERLKGQLIRGACAAQIEMETNCKEEAYNEVLSFIDYLQKEQPECVYGKTLEEREKYCKFCSIICKARIEQEQPEVDLEKEFKKWWDSVASSINVDHSMYWYMEKCAEHFYELDKNAK